MKNSFFHFRTSPGRAAFTLVEVMLSLFLVLILMVGMNAVFKATGDTVRAGNTLGEQTRNTRAVQPILFNDLASCATDSPAFIISSSVVPQYLNAADATANNAAPGTLPLLGGLTATGSGGTGNVGCILGDHLHRCDMLSFFARGLFKRKTADGQINVSGTIEPGYLSSTTTSNEAWIHYGHLAVSTDGQNFIGPDDYAGASEPYASNWVLGRNVLLLSDPAFVEPNELNLGGKVAETFYPADPYPGAAFGVSGGQLYFPNQWRNVGALAPAANVFPFVYGATNYNSTSGEDLNAGSNLPNYPIQSSRYDLAGTTINEFKSTVSLATAAQAQQVVGTAHPYFFWWAPMVYQQPHYSATIPGAPYYPYTPTINLANAGTPNPVAPKDTSIPGPVSPLAGANVSWFPKFRFQGNTALSSSPLTGASGSADQAGLSSYLLEHVSQFIVEYAGDFTTQDSVGNVTDTVGDGQIDWMYATKGDWTATTIYQPGDYVIYTGSATGYWLAVAPITGTNPVNPQWIANVTPPKQIRWYGMPRDSSGSGHVWSSFHPAGVTLPGGHTVGASPPNSNELNNVVPLVDVWRTSLANNTRPVPYEVEAGPTLLNLNGGSTQNFVAGAAPTSNVWDYAYEASNTDSDPNYANSGTYYLGRYTAVFQNTVPSMVRILIKVDDPSNAVQNGPWFEYVFKLK